MDYLVTLQVICISIGISRSYEVTYLAMLWTFFGAVSCY